MLLNYMVRVNKVVSVMGINNVALITVYVYYQFDVFTLSLTFTYTEAIC